MVNASGESVQPSSAARPLVLATVAIGITIAVVGLLIAQGLEFSFITPLLAVLAAVPYLLYARLAVRQPGAEAVVGGVLLIAVGTWGYIGAIDDPGVGRLLALPLYLVAMEAIVFAIGWMLRNTIGRTDVAETEPDDDRRLAR